MRHAEYMTWPRAFAIAESVWSPKEKKDWKQFFPRVEQHFERFNVAEIKYAPSVYDPIFTPSRVDGKLQIKLATEVEGLNIHYSFDNSFPDHFYPRYTTPLVPPKDAVMLKVITYKGKQPVGRMIAMPIEEMMKRSEPKK
jgi:hexosaminidase